MYFSVLSVLLCSLYGHAIYFSDPSHHIDDPYGMADNREVRFSAHAVPKSTTFRPPPDWSSPCAFTRRPGERA